MILGVNFYSIIAVLHVLGIPNILIVYQIEAILSFFFGTSSFYRMMMQKWAIAMSMKTFKKNLQVQDY